MAMMVERFMGSMYLVEPVMICWTIRRLAFCDGWNGSQNAYWSLLVHRVDATVQSPIPLYGPCPQHATFDVMNPATFKDQIDKDLTCEDQIEHWKRV